MYLEYAIAARTKKRPRNSPCYEYPESTNIYRGTQRYYTTATRCIWCKGAVAACVNMCVRKCALHTSGELQNICHAQHSHGAQCKAEASCTTNAHRSHRSESFFFVCSERTFVSMRVKFILLLSFRPPMMGNYRCVLNGILSSLFPI